MNRPILIAVLFVAMAAGFVGGVGGGLVATRLVSPTPTETKTAIANLEEGLATLAHEVAALKREVASSTHQSKELIERALVRSTSQEEQLVRVVERTVPAVISIVATKQVPLLEVEYVNPFGDDPLFHDVDVRIPVWRYRGVRREQVGAGTGFIVTRDGLALTNRHVVADPTASYVALLSDGRQIPLRVQYRDPRWDLAVVALEGPGAPFPTVPLGSARTLHLGQRVVVIGNALGMYRNTVTTGIVSGLNRRVVAYDAYGQSIPLDGVFQTDAAINPGNSGGPVLTLDGVVVGIATATVRGSENIGFAIPIDVARTVLSQLRKDGGDRH